MAGRIPEHFIQDLLERTDIVAVIDERVQLKKTGRNYSARCPFHDEKTPSFSVAPDKQFYYCFGCGATGTAITFLMEYDHLDFPEAVEQLAGRAGLEVPREGGDGRKTREEQDRLKPIYEILERAERFYRQQLKSAREREKAVNYLKDRGLTGEIAARFGLGLAPPGFDNLITGLSLDEAGIEQALTAGLLVRREDTGRVYDKFRDRVIFPIRDARGRTVAFGGRLLGDGKPKYLNSPETTVYHKGRELYGLHEWRQSRDRSSRLFVVEGYMDVIALHQFGIPNVVATLGTATTAEHAQLLFRQVDEAVLCFDGDDAGRRAAWRALESLLERLDDGKEARFLFLPEGYDPDSLVRERGAEALQADAEQAPGLTRFLFERLSEGLDTDTVDGRARLARRAAPLIHRPPGDFYRALLRRELAERTRLSEAELERVLDKGQAEQPAQPEDPPTPEPPSDSAPAAAPARARGNDRRRMRVVLLERLLLTLVHYPHLVREQPLPEALEQLDHPLADVLIRMSEIIRQADTEPPTPVLLGHLMALDQGELLAEVIRSSEQVAGSPEAARREWLGGLNQLNIERLEADIGAEERADQPDVERIAALSRQLHEARARQDPPLQ
jgi:DNA primase